LGIPGGENIQNMVYLIILISNLLAGMLVFLSGKGYLRLITKMFYKELETDAGQITQTNKEEPNA